MSRRAWAAGFLVLGACAQPEVIEVDLGGDQTSGWVVVVLLDDTGMATRTLTPLIVDRGRLVEGRRPDLEINQHESAAVAVVIADAELDRTLPGRLGPTLDVALTVEPPPAQPSFEVDARAAVVRRATAIPEAGRLLRFDKAGAERELYPNELEREQLVAQLKLSAVVDPEYCRSPYGPLMPFGENEAPFAGGMLPDLETVFRVDERRVIASSRDEVYLLRRGELYTRTPTVAGPSPSVRLQALDPTAGTNTAITALAVTGRGGVTDRAWVLVLDHRPNNPTLYDSAVYEIGVAEEGLTIIGTSTRAIGPAVRALAAAPDGELAMTREDNTVWFRSPSSGAWSRSALPPVQPDLEDDVRRIAAVPDAEITWLTATRGRAHRYNKRMRSWDVEEAVVAGLNAPRFPGITASTGPGGVEYWVGSDNLFRSRGQGYTEQRLELPPAYAPCAVRDAPYRLDRQISALAAEDGYLYVAVDYCWMIMAIRTDDLCVSLIVRPGGPESRLGHVLALDLKGGELLLSGDDGALASSRR